MYRLLPKTIIVTKFRSHCFKSGTSSTEMDCTAVDAVYDRIKDSVKSTPMYQILRGLLILHKYHFHFM
jgi:hypothetical protein